MPVQKETSIVVFTTTQEAAEKEANKLIQAVVNPDGPIFEAVLVPGKTVPATSLDPEAWLVFFDVTMAS